MYISFNVWKLMTDFKWWLLYRNTLKHLTVCKKKNGLIVNIIIRIRRQNLKPFNCAQKNKWAQTRLKMLSAKCVSYIYVLRGYGIK